MKAALGPLAAAVTSCQKPSLLDVSRVLKAASFRKLTIEAVNQQIDVFALGLRGAGANGFF